MLMSIGLFYSCTEVSKQVEEKLDKLKNTAVQIDSIVDSGVRKIKQLDTLVNSETDKKQLIDSLVNKGSLKIDSIANNKIEQLKKIIK